MKPGYTTTEFWTVVTTNVLAIITTVFHKKVGVSVTQIADTGALLGNIVYGILRTRLKAVHAKAVVSKADVAKS